MISHMGTCADWECRGECVQRYDDAHRNMRRISAHAAETCDAPMSIADVHDVKLGANPKQLYGDKKVPLHFIPPAGTIYLGLAMKEGARKYGAYNWRKTKVESMTYIGAALRHIEQMLDGEDIDPETGDAQVPHAALAMACLAIYADAMEGGFMIDNRPPRGPASALLKRYTK